VLESRDQLEIGERLTLFELDARGALVNTNGFSLCNPGRGDQINPLYRNPQRVEARYQALFEGPLQAAFADLVEPKESPASPILESLARLAQTTDVRYRDRRAAKSSSSPTCCRIPSCFPSMAARAAIWPSACPIPAGRGRGRG
jgi:hypothetical protein